MRVPLIADEDQNQGASRNCDNSLQYQKIIFLSNLKTKLPTANHIPTVAK